MPTRLLGESLAWPLAFGLVEDVLTVDDDQILDAVRCTAVELKQAVEPAGAVALAAALSSRLRRAARRGGLGERGPRRVWGERGLGRSGGRALSG